jgi:quinone-modifying oxidoreductase subunit QmoC
MQAIRALVIEHVAAPRPLARLVANARTTWPILLGAPILFWALYVRAVTGFEAPTPLSYTAVVPTWMIYSVFLPAAAFAVLAAFLGARRSWAAWGADAPRRGGLVAGLAGVVADILAHRRFERCGEARPRRSGHLVLVLGFLGALVTTTLLGIAMDVLHVRTPLPQGHLIKLIGNASAILLVVGLALLVLNRARGNGAGKTRAFDLFFLSLVAVVVLSGVGAELGRIFLPAGAAIAIYLVHLGSILSLFVTFPFSKFAHALYRTLAMAHERLVSERSPS